MPTPAVRPKCLASRSTAERFLGQVTARRPSGGGRGSDEYGPGRRASYIGASSPGTWRASASDRGQASFATGRRNRLLPTFRELRPASALARVAPAALADRL